MTSWSEIACSQVGWIVFLVKDSSCVLLHIFGCGKCWERVVVETYNWLQIWWMLIRNIIFLLPFHQGIFITRQRMSYALVTFIKIHWMEFIVDTEMSGDEIVCECRLSVSVDLLELSRAQSVFDQHKLTHNEQLLEIPGIVNCLCAIYRELQQVHPDLVNVPLCVDLCLNWLLKVYDRSVWVLSSIEWP